MFNRQAYIASAVAEAKKNLTWNGPGSEAYKYTTPFIPIFGAARFSWCGAFQLWNVNKAGGKVGIRASKPVPNYESYTFALVEYWQQWALHNGFYHHNNGAYKPQPGDQIIFDWEGIKADSGWDDHIGMVVGVLPNGMIHTAEGNTGNATAEKQRSPSLINGYISIPEGFQI